MALTGKGSLSLRKQDLSNEKSIALGFQKLVFATKAAGGETGIDLTALSAPSEMTSIGFTNPSTAAIAGANLKFNRRNFLLKSSLRGVLIDFLAFDVASSTRINFIGFTAEPGEILIGTLDDNPKTNLLAVDAQPIVVTGSLSANSTDFNVGVPFPINKNPSAQVGAVLVFKDGVQQYRNVNNATATPGADGNYQEVDPGGGLGVIIRFNIADNNDHNILVFNPGLAERPDGSMMAVIENLAGQLDQVIPTVAALAGVLPSAFQVAPNNVDLKAFGDQVTANTAELAAHDPTIQKINNLVSARYHTTSAQAVPNSTYTVINFDIADYDEHGIVTPGSGWKFIAPRTAKYKISAYLELGGVTSAGNVSQMSLGINTQSAESVMLDAYRFGTTTDTSETSGSTTVKLNAGSYISLLMWHNASGGSLTLPSTASRAWICIEEQPNS